MTTPCKVRVAPTQINVNENSLPVLECGQCKMCVQNSVCWFAVHLSGCANKHIFGTTFGHDFDSQSVSPFKAKMLICFEY